MIDTLAWAGKVQAHMAARGGASAPIVLFRDEDEIQTLVTQWDGDSFRRQQIMDQIMTREPAFESVHSAGLRQRSGPCAATTPST